MDREHSLILRGEKLEIHGITSIIGYGEREASFNLENGKITVTGEGLTCVKLDVEGGTCELSGRVSGIRYGAKSGGFLRKLVK